MNTFTRISGSCISDEYSLPSLVQVGSNLLAAKFDLMKFTPAKNIIDDALLKGKLRRGGHVLESSSGTFALALSILSSIYDFKLTLVTGQVSDIVRWRLENLGAQLHVVNGSKNCEGGIQQARLNLLYELLDQDKDAFWPQQYTNPKNSASYKPVAEYILKQQKKLDVIVGSVGSGGSLFGLTRYLRETNPDLRTIAVDHNRSVIFGANAAKITDMCRDTFEQILAMGAGIPMGNVWFEACDEVHWIPVPKMVQKVDEFHRETGLLVGPSSGAALCVAQLIAEQDKSLNVLTILPDHGVRYVETMFNPNWLKNWEVDLQRSWDRPVQVKSLDEVTDGWCWFDWNRRPFQEVKGASPLPRQQGYNP